MPLLKTSFAAIAFVAALAAVAGPALACKPKVVDEGIGKWSRQFIVANMRRKGFKCVENGRSTHTVPHQVNARNCSANQIAQQRRPDNCTAGIRSDKIRFRAACFEHDLCYSTRGTTRQECDRKFRDNLMFICDRIKNRGACRLSAGAFFTAVTVAGGKRYNQFQASAPRDASGAQCSK